MIVIGILSTICGYDEYTEMELFGEMKEEWLRGFLELPHGIPSHDTFGDIFTAINPKALHECFAEWVEAKLIKRYMDEMGFYMEYYGSR